MVQRRLAKPKAPGPVLRLLSALSLSALGLAGCASVGPPADRGGVTASAGALRGTDRPYQVDGRWYYPHAQPGYDVVGSASWYGQQFHNHHTADGEIFDQYALSAAHKTLPLPCVVEVTNLDNGRKLKLRVNDRGPFVGDRLIDVSRAAAEALGFRDQGLTHVRVRYVGPAPPLAATTYARAYLAPHHLSDEAEPDLEVAAASTRSDGAGPASTTASDLDDDDNPSPPPSAAPAVHAGGFAVQAAAFASRENAQRAAGQLGAVGPASIRPITTNSGLTLYRVMLSGYADANAAEAARGQVVAAGYGDARVIAPF